MSLNFKSISLQVTLLSLVFTISTSFSVAAKKKSAPAQPAEKPTAKSKESAPAVNTKKPEEKKPEKKQKEAPVVTPEEEDAFKQMDPHGTPSLNLKKANIDELANCQTCHFMEKGKLKTQPEPDNICHGCHGRLPHSGLVEHMGLEPGGGAGLNCLGCHRPHRASLDPASAVEYVRGNPAIKLKRVAPNFSPDVVDRPSRSPMIDHPCSECHSW